MDYRIELIHVPVSDVDRHKQFYVEQAGFVCDVDQSPSEGLRFVQCTPPGSACSIAFGVGLNPMVPGSQKGIQAVVADAQAAHDQLAANGVEVTDVDDQPWGRFVFFHDPDGNAWTLQQLPEWRQS